MKNKGSVPALNLGLQKPTVEWARSVEHGKDIFKVATDGSIHQEFRKYVQWYQLLMMRAGSFVKKVSLSTSGDAQRRVD